MRKGIFLIIISTISIACNNKKEAGLLLPVENVYIIEISPSTPDYREKGDTTYMLILGLAEIDKNFNMKLTYRDGYRGSYLSGDIEISDSLKYKIVDMIRNYPTDSLFAESTDLIYDGPLYMFLIETESGKFIKLNPSPIIQSDLLSIQQEVYNNSIRSRANHLNENQDSVKTRIREFDQEVAKVFKPSHFPRGIIRFTPPTKEQL